VAKGKKTCIGTRAKKRWPGFTCEKIEGHWKWSALSAQPAKTNKKRKIHGAQLSRNRKWREAILMSMVTARTYLGLEMQMQLEPPLSSSLLASLPVPVNAFDTIRYESRALTTVAFQGHWRTGGGGWSNGGTVVVWCQWRWYDVVTWRPVMVTATVPVVVWHRRGRAGTVSTELSLLGVSTM